MSSVVDSWRKQLQHIRSLETRYQRTPNSVRLLAVSKKQSLDKIQALIAAGQHDFGENYLAEALSKLSAIQHKNLTWHFIGRLQSRKIAQIASHFSWIHSVSRLKEAELLNEYRGQGSPLNVCIQVNVQGLDNKSGVAPEATLTFAKQVHALPNLRLRGLMTLPEPERDWEAQCKPFKAVKQIFDELNDAGLACDTLSMGTSQDYEAAIASGATMVRLGESIFGPRV